MARHVLCADSTNSLLNLHPQPNLRSQVPVSEACVGCRAHVTLPASSLQTGAKLQPEGHESLHRKPRHKLLPLIPNLERSETPEPCLPGTSCPSRKLRLPPGASDKPHLQFQFTGTENSGLGAREANRVLDRSRLQGSVCNKQGLGLQTWRVSGVGSKCC